MATKKLARKPAPKPKPATTTALAVRPKARTLAPPPGPFTIQLYTPPPEPVSSPESIERGTALTPTGVIGDGIGTLALPQKAIEKLLAPVHPDILEILPTGEVYLPQVEYRRILNAAVGPGAWGMKPGGTVTTVGRTVIQLWQLVILKKVVAVTWGEADYQEDNKRTTWATAVESAKSNALMRCCKDLGIAAECWDRGFTERFKTDLCVCVIRPNARNSNEDDLCWRRLDQKPWYDEKGVARNSPNRDKWREQAGQAKTAASAPAATGQTSAATDGRPISQKQRNYLWFLVQTRGWSTAEVKAHLKKTYGTDHTASLDASHFNAVKAWLETRPVAAREPGQEG